MSEAETNESGQAKRGTGPTAPWERRVIERLATAALKEQRRTRIWNLVFRFLFIAYLIAIPVLYFPLDWPESDSVQRHTALIDVSGVITAGGEASADRVVSALRAAFEDENTAGVIVRINSPGGSPVQAGYVNDEMRRLRKEHPDVPLIAVIADVAASGGYYVAAGAKEIYADKASLLGSIGVLMNGFGFVDAMENLGVERRLLTAGKNKALLDPFSPLRPEHERHISSVLEQIHYQFIAVVKAGRGDKLKPDADLFSGLIWSGEEGLALGLIDGLGSSSFVAREIIGAKEIKDFTARKGYIEILADRLGASIARHLRLETTSWIPQLN